MTVFDEATRLYALGFAILWLKPKDKRPIDMGWTTGERKHWDALQAQYRTGMNVGVRLGTPSLGVGSFLYVIDCDVKSTDPKHQIEMEEKLSELFPQLLFTPSVLSGRGNGSRHVYVRSKVAITEKRLASSRDRIKLGKSQKQAWEIVLMGEGRQVVLPPSIHPESGKPYVWEIPLVGIDDIPFLETEGLENEKRTKKENLKGFSFEVEAVDFDSLPKDVQEKLNGAGDHDRSAVLYGVLCSLLRHGLTDNQILTLLTDTSYELSEVAYRHRETTDRKNAAHWIKTQNLDKAKKKTWALDEFEKVVEVAPLSEEETDKQTAEMLPERKTTLTYENYDDIESDVSTSALVKGLLDHNAAAVLYGDTNSGKTFFMLDMALHIAQGKEWQGRKTEESLVIYIAAEGGRRVKDRVVAFRKQNPSKKGAVNFILARGVINLLTGDAIPAFLDDIKQIELKEKRPVRLIVIDTLSRTISGGDENDSKDMGSFIRHVDEIREKTKSAIVAVHHSGKNQGKGARGHSSLKGAVDTEIEVKLFDPKKHPGIKAAFIRKQRDFDYGPPMGFKLKQVEVAEDETGEMITSCVVEPFNLETIQFENVEENYELSERAEQALEILHSLLAVSGADIVDIQTWYHEFAKAHFKDKTRQASHKALEAVKAELLGLGLIKIDNKSVNLVKR